MIFLNFPYVFHTLLPILLVFQLCCQSTSSAEATAGSLMSLSSGNPYAFDERGRLAQAESAFEAANHGGIAIAIKSQKACVLLSFTGQEKYLSTRHETSTDLVKKHGVIKLTRYISTNLIKPLQTVCLSCDFAI